jgi:predicted permease
MSLWRQIVFGLRALTNTKASDQDINDEVDAYLQQAVAELIDRGLSPAEARRSAQLELGHRSAIREQVRSYGWENAFGTLFADVRYAVRRLRNSPGFTTVGALTLALGIGASTAIFSAVNPILFEPLPYPQPQRIVMIWDIFEGTRADLTFHTYRELLARNHSFEALAVKEAQDPWQPTMTSPASHPERFAGQSVSANYFRVFGVPPALGRDFQEADDRFKGPHVVILSDKLWRRRFSSDSAILGHHIKLDGDPYTLIGIMPKGFNNVLAPSAELWSPLQLDTTNIGNFETQEWGHHLHMVGRLRPGVGVDAARRELAQIARAPMAEFPRPRWASLSHGFMVNSLQSETTRGVKAVLLAILGAVALLLLIACVNVTNLLLARGAQRQGEYAMRAALGAARSRLIRQILTESTLLALIGGALGIVAAEFGVRALIALSPPGLPRVDAIAVNGAVFAFAFGVTTVIGLLVGVVPALDASSGDLPSGLQQASKRTVRSHQGTRRALVVTEVALALVLLASAGLVLRSLQHLFAVPPGFDVSNLLTMQVQESGHRFEDGRVARQFFAQALEEVSHVPAVASAAFTSLLPLSGGEYETYGASFEPAHGHAYDAFRYVVTPGYFHTMGIALRRGRFLDTHDTETAPSVVLISEWLAKTEFQDRDPIGQRMHVGPSNRPLYTVVGVVGDVKQTSLAETQPAAVYITPSQSWFVDTRQSLVVRAHGNAIALTPTIKRAIWSVDKDQAIVHVVKMDELLAASEAERRFALIVFDAFALMALLLAAGGIYGVLAGSVTERTPEIGVRSALGASRSNILGLVVRQGMTLTGLGVFIGLAGAAVATKALVTLLFGVSRLDPVTYLAVVALLACVSVIACGVPAWRAARIDPALALRAE